MLHRLETRRGRLADWIRRYGPAELVGTTTAVIGSYLVHAWTGNEVAAAYGGAIGESLGFYSLIIAQEIRADQRLYRAADRDYGVRQWMETATNLVVEFGGGELLDSAVVRPLAMGVATHYLGRGWGVTVGKLLADISFYVPVILTYELRRAVQRRRGGP